MGAEHASEVSYTSHRLKNYEFDTNKVRLFTPSAPNIWGARGNCHYYPTDRENYRSATNIGNFQLF